MEMKRANEGQLSLPNDPLSLPSEDSREKVPSNRLTFPHPTIKIKSLVLHPYFFLLSSQIFLQVLIL